MKLWIKAVWLVIGTPVCIFLTFTIVFLIALNEMVLLTVLTLSFLFLVLLLFFGIVLKVQKKHSELIEEEPE